MTERILYIEDVPLKFARISGDYPDWMSHEAMYNQIVPDAHIGAVRDTDSSEPVIVGIDPAWDLERRETYEPLVRISNVGPYRGHASGTK